MLYEFGDAYYYHWSSMPTTDSLIESLNQNYKSEKDFLKDKRN
jgi:hypothetical protein